MKKHTDQILFLPEVKLEYPSLFQPVHHEQFASKYKTYLLIKENTIAYQAVKDRVQNLITQHGRPSTPDKICLKSEGELAPHCWSISTGNKLKPLLLNRDKSPLTEELHADKIYRGTIVNAAISIWYQRKYGGGIFSELYGIQFVRDDVKLNNNPDPEVVLSQFIPLDMKIVKDDDDDLRNLLGGDNDLLEGL